MDLVTVGRVLRLRQVLRRRERWDRSRLHDHQQRELSRLRSFAVEHSAFYQRCHAGLTHSPLEELPVLTKAALMDHFDEISTDSSVRLADLQTYLDGLRGNERFAGRYWVSATSGSSGRRSIIPNDPDEWATIIASYARANEWAGIRSGLTHRISMAVVSSTTAWHQSSRVAATVHSPFIYSQRLDAASRLPEIVARLNDLQPDVLIAYASMIRILADEQLAGRLRITPRAVNSSSEVLTPEARALATAAWGVPPYNVYAATETGGIAAECREHHGLHLFEDLVVPEVVDENDRPVPPGTTGARLLVTVLFSRTIPLIRYEMTDRVRLTPQPCPCGLPFRLLEGIEGRTDDVLHLPAIAGGTVQVQPVVFHQILDLLDTAGWQVHQRPDRLEVLLASPAAAVDPTRTGRAIRAVLTQAGVAPTRVDVNVVPAIPPGPAGKRPLVMAHATATTGPAPSQPSTTLMGTRRARRSEHASLDASNIDTYTP
jgi:putative adenylate-forming enzyme